MNKKIKVFFQTNILPFLLQLFVRFIYITSKKEFFYPQINQDETYVIAFWHGNLLMQPFNHKKLRQNRAVQTIISEHRDGITISKTVQYLGIKTIIGSTTRGGAKALISAIKTIKNKIDVAITPDGPKGPKYFIADGIVVLAQKTNSKIIALHYEASKFWRLNSWDNFIIPKPFGKLKFYASEPLDINQLSLDEAKQILQQNMRKYDE